MQDLPPKGGFDGSFVYKRNLPSKGPNGAVLLTAVTAMIGCGLFLHRRSVHLMHELDREKLQGRLQVMPMIIAEADRRILREEAKLLELQKRAKDAGFEAAGDPVYHNRNNYIKSTTFRL